MSPEGYLRNKLESEADQIEIPSFLDTPLGRIDYASQTEADFDVQNERSSARIHIEWEPSKNDFSEVDNFLYGEYGEGDEVAPAEKGLWLIIKKISFAANGKISGLDFNNLGIVVGYNPSSKTSDFAFVSAEKKTVFISGDITRPSVILNLLHEVGHLMDFKRLTDEVRQNVFEHLRAFIENQQNPGEKELSEEAMSVTLNRERNAWAFVLKTIHPLIQTGLIAKKDALAYIHRYALHTYSDAIRTTKNIAMLDAILAKMEEEFSHLEEDLKKKGYATE